MHAFSISVKGLLHWIVKCQFSAIFQVREKEIASLQYEIWSRSWDSKLFSLCQTKMLPNWWHCLLYIHTLGQLTLHQSFSWTLYKNPLLNTCYKSHKNPVLTRENKSSTHSSKIGQTVTTAWPSTSGIRNCKAKQGERQMKSQCRFIAV